MTDVKCPHCSQVRPSRSRLYAHLSVAHDDIERTAAARSVACQKAREIEDAPGIDAFEYSPMTEDERQAALGLLSDRYDRMAVQVADLKAAFDQVDTRFRALDAAATLPDEVRRLTLDAVWHKLVEAENIEGARIVIGMMQEEGLL